MLVIAVLDDVLDYLIEDGIETVQLETGDDLLNEMRRVVILQKETVITHDLLQLARLLTSASSSMESWMLVIV